MKIWLMFLTPILFLVHGFLRLASSIPRIFHYLFYILPLDVNQWLGYLLRYAYDRIGARPLGYRRQIRVFDRGRVLFSNKLGVYHMKLMLLTGVINVQGVEGESLCH